MRAWPRPTVRRILRDAGLRSPLRQRLPKHRSRREETPISSAASPAVNLPSITPVRTIALRCSLPFIVMSFMEDRIKDQLDRTKSQTINTERVQAREGITISAKSIDRVIARLKGHTIPLIAYQMLHHGGTYEDLGVNYFDERDRDNA